MFLNYISKKYFLLILFLIFGGFSFAQQAAISGKITDENNEPLTGTVAELRNAGDSSLAKVNVADAQGMFSFQNVKAGNYFLKTSLLGFTPYRSEAFAYDGVSSKE